MVHVDGITSLTTKTFESMVCSVRGELHFTALLHVHAYNEEYIVHIQLTKHNSHLSRICDLYLYSITSLYRHLHVACYSSRIVSRTCVCVCVCVF